MNTPTALQFSLVKYLNEQFPATAGHIPIADKISELRDAEWNAAIEACRQDNIAYAKIMRGANQNVNQVATELNRSHERLKRTTKHTHVNNGVDENTFKL